MHTEQELTDAHKRSFRNKECLDRSKMAGCFYCREIFDADLVSEYVREEQTGLCPKCSIDSVIGDASGIEISRSFLTSMHNYWFRRGTDQQGNLWQDEPYRE